MKAHCLAAFMAGALLVGGACAQDFPSEEQLALCYKEAGNDQNAVKKCLDTELAAVQAEYKEVGDRVMVEVKRRDKGAGNRDAWRKAIAAQQNYENYVKNECAVARLMEKGSRVKLDNAVTACRIGLYRTRTQMLENRYLRGGD